MSDRMVHIVKRPSVASAYEELIPLILEKGETVCTEDNQKTKELRNVVVQITNPSLKKVPQKYPFGEKRLQEYKRSILEGTKSNFTYSYNERLCCYEVENKVINQIDYIINKLQKSPTSRRAIAITWKPWIDCHQKHVPCLISIQFLNRNDYLCMTVYFRSNDLLLAFPANALALIELGEKIARETGTILKEYVHHSVSMHIYIERDKTLLEKVWNYREW